jgi:hypothetical protein|tara:strand:+ start:1496 stop:1912 length:417 start_codon:yes stop_codon:yes gene_type:complete
MSIGKNMMLVNSSFRGAKSFNLIPVSKEAPYIEAMFDPSSGILACIGVNNKQSFHMVPRLNDDGQPMRLKVPNKATGKTVKEQRVSQQTYSEYYVAEKNDIENFINIFAINADTFDYKQFIDVDIKKTETSKIILPGQ